MSVTTERLRTPEVRTVVTGTRRRGGWAIVAIAILLAVGTALALLWPSSTPIEPAGRVESGAQQAAQIWTVKAAQAPLLGAQGSPAGFEAARGGEISRSTLGAATSEWAAKAAFGRARLAASATQGSSAGLQATPEIDQILQAPPTSGTSAEWAVKAAYGRALGSSGR